MIPLGTSFIPMKPPAGGFIEHRNYVAYGMASE